MITPADLLAPQGPVEEGFFPNDDAAAITVRLQTYIDRAVAKTSARPFLDPDAATLAWALHLTFEAAYLVACTRPANENSMVPVLGSEGYAKDQRDALKEQSLHYRDEYLMLENRVPMSDTLPSTPQSREVPTRYEW